MLETAFLNDHNPIHWAICHIPSSILSGATLPEIPPVILRLLECCRGLSVKSVDSILEAFCLRDTNALLQVIHSAASSPYRITHSNWPNPDQFEFCIPDFPTHILVEGEVVMRFISRCEWLWPVLYADRLGN